MSSEDTLSSSIADSDAIEFSLIKPARSTLSTAARDQRAPLHPTEDDLLRSISHKVTEEEAERTRVQLFELYGQDGDSSNSKRHAGIVFKHLTVKGQAFGAEYQPEVLDPVHKIWLWLKKTCVGLRSTEAQRTLLNDFSGIIKPGQMLLVLGRPSAGCSTFLKSIGNQREGFAGFSGKLTYGGIDHRVTAKDYGNEVLYSGEEDLHYPTLTVRQTLVFALKTRVPKNTSWYRKSDHSSYIDDFLRLLVRVFWLEHALDTVVGNESIRGISGGEKKRMSIAEAFISKASNLCFDCPTRGLDASTAREYVKSLRALSNMANVSIAAALYQASEQLFQHFDKVLVIDQGHCLYFGPIEKSVPYFENLGLLKPPRWTSADFLISIMDKEERVMKPGYENRIPSDAAHFGQIFQKSELNRVNWEEIKSFEAELEPPRRSKPLKWASSSRYGLSLAKQILICTHRQLLIIAGDKKSLSIKWGGLLFNSTIIGTLFLNLRKTTSGVFPRGGMLWILLLNNSLIALAEMTAIFNGRSIMQKHKSFAFHRPAAAAFAQSAADIPLIFVQILLSDLIAYFLADLQRTAARFFISVLLLWAVTMTFYAFFRALAALFTSLDGALKFAGVAVQAFITYTGYLIPPKDMRAALSWLRFVNPTQYAFEALLANEFYGLQVRCEAPYLVPAQNGISVQNQGCAIHGSVPGSDVVDGERYIESAYDYRHSDLWRDFTCICAFFIIFLAVSALGLELQSPHSRKGAMTLFKRGKGPVLVRDELDNASKNKSVGKSRPEGIAEFVDGQSSPSLRAADSETTRKAGLTWLKLNYSVAVKHSTRELLTNQQGWLEPGTLTALMGASGAGKTTLLNALAQRIQVGNLSGEILLNGRHLLASFQRHTGYAEQMDVHDPTATVREALRLAATLRQPKETSHASKHAHVEDIIDLLDLRPLADTVIGSPSAGLNLEQRKRLTIGIEIASRADLYFCDEPTSGLDAASALKIIRLLKKLSGNGSTILCTVHQPSAILFEHFDQLLLLKSGQSIYHGPIGSNSWALRAYLESNGATKCAPDANPAEWMLEVTGAGDPNYKGRDWVETWNASVWRQQQASSIREIKRRARNEDKPVDRPYDDHEFAMPLSTQILAVTKRRFTAYWRMPQYVYGKLLLHVFPALLNTFTFYKLGRSEIDMQSRLFSVFQTINIAPPVIQQLQPRYIEARNLCESREGTCKMYSWIAFTFASIAVEIPYAFVSGTIYFFCWYYGPGFPRDSYTVGVTYLYMLLLESFFTSFGLALAALAPNELTASLLVPVFFQLIIRFAGAFVPPADLPSFWRAWMYPLTPFRYFLEGMLGLVVHDVPVRCAREELALFRRPSGLPSGLAGCERFAGDWVRSVGVGYLVGLDMEGDRPLCGYCRFKNGDEFAASFNIYYKNRWRDFGIGWLYIVVNLGFVFLFTWLYLEGGAKLKAAMRRLRKRHEEEEEELVEAARSRA